MTPEEKLEEIKRHFDLISRVKNKIPYGQLMKQALITNIECLVYDYDLYENNLEQVCKDVIYTPTSETT